MRIGSKVSSQDARYQKTEKSLMRRILNLLRRRGGHISVREVCTGVRVGKSRDERGAGENGSGKNEKVSGKSEKVSGKSENASGKGDNANGKNDSANDKSFGTRKEKDDFCTTVTFYNHYRDIDDAIEQMEARLLKEFEERLEKLEMVAKAVRPERTERAGAEGGLVANGAASLGLATNGAVGLGLTAEQVLAEMLKFMRQNKQVFIVTAECWRLGTYEGIFRLVYPYVSRSFPKYAGAAVQEELFWMYLGQNVAVVMAWVRQTECSIDEEKKCLTKLLAVQGQMGRYLREVGVAEYRDAKVKEADLPRNVLELVGRNRGSGSVGGGSVGGGASSDSAGGVYGSGMAGGSVGAGNAGVVPWWRKDDELKHGRNDIDKRQQGREQGGRRN